MKSLVAASTALLLLVWGAVNILIPVYGAVGMIMGLVQVALGCAIVYELVHRGVDFPDLGVTVLAEFLILAFGFLLVLDGFMFHTITFAYPAWMAGLDPVINHAYYGLVLIVIGAVGLTASSRR